MRLRLLKKYIFIIGLALILCAAFGYLYYNDYRFEWSIPDKQEIVVEYGQPYKDEPVTAKVRGKVFNRNGKELDVIKKGKVDTGKVGLYVLHYETTYHNKKDSITRTVVVKDTTAPVLSLKGEATVYVEAGNEYADPGFSATDLCDGDVTGEVLVEGIPEMTVPGDYTLIYRVKDHAGNEAEMKRMLRVSDTTPPKLELKGEQTVSLTFGSTYEEPGYLAEDAADGDCTDAVVVSGTVDTDRAGSYTLTYSVTDRSGNKTDRTRMVSVAPPQTEKEPSAETASQAQGTASAQAPDGGENGKVIYLTFDDGPGPYTAKLLDILDKYGVKATFFVTNTQPKYRGMIGEEAARGHTIAIHTGSHEYSEIYQSTEAYFADMQIMSDIIVEQTGQTPWLMRFPGGSSNLVSAKYCKGIMGVLTEEVERRGYQYCDWNVSSGDAGETTSTSVVVDNVISGVQSKNISVVLQHDIKGFSVDAVEEIIKWGQANGYTFLPLTNTSPMTHHHVQN